MTDTTKKDELFPTKDLTIEFRAWEKMHNRDNYGRYDAFKAGHTLSLLALRSSHEKLEGLEKEKSALRTCVAVLLENAECREDEDCDHCYVIETLKEFET